MGAKESVNSTFTLNTEENTSATVNLNLCDFFIVVTT